MAPSLAGLGDPRQELVARTILSVGSSIPDHRWTTALEAFATAKTLPRYLRQQNPSPAGNDGLACHKAGLLAE